MNNKLHRDFSRARKAFLKAKKNNNRLVCLALHKAMLKIHEKLLLINE